MNLLGSGMHSVISISLLCLSIFSYAQDWKFTEVSAQANLNIDTENAPFVGVAAGDYNNDGFTDLMICRSGSGSSLLFRNNGDGTFEDVSFQAGLAIFGQAAFSPLFFDYNGDGWQDLIVTISGAEIQKMFRNNGNGTFTEVTATAGISQTPNAYSPVAADYDLDGDLDLYVATLNRDGGTTHLWRNDGDGVFTGISDESGINIYAEKDNQFTPNFADINNDGWPDLLSVGDFNTSEVFLNKGDGSFERITDREVITDEGGMGGAVADYDNDGDLDWFVSSIYDPDQDPNKPWGVSSGNRLYRNKGDGTFEDATDEAGVRIGWWGWGSTFGDFNNDGFQDIFHTNGFVDPNGPFFQTDPAVLYIANGDGTFSERAEELGVIDNGHGHGVICFDYDRDGDQDLFVANSTGGVKLFRNDGGNANNWVNIRLRDKNSQNKLGIGARVWLQTEMARYMREVSCGNNYLSQNPSDAHIGMGTATTGDLEIRWTDGVRNKLFNVASGEDLTLVKIPVSFDATHLSYYEYLSQVDASLKLLRNAGDIDRRMVQRLRFSALKAFILEKYTR